MKKVLYIVGVGVVVGAVVVTFYFLNKKKKNASEEVCEYNNFDGQFEGENGESSTDVIIARNESVYEDVKSSATRSMYSRHKGAVTIMSDSVDEIRENIKMSEGTNNEIDDISDELDRMISED